MFDVEEFVIVCVILDWYEFILVLKWLEKIRIGVFLGYIMKIDIWLCRVDWNIGDRVGYFRLGWVMKVWEFDMFSLVCFLSCFFYIKLFLE